MTIGNHGFGQGGNVFRKHGHHFLQRLRVFLHKAGNHGLRIAPGLLEFNAPGRGKEVVEYHHFFTVSFCQDTAEFYLFLNPVRISAQGFDVFRIPDGLQVMKLLVGIEEKSVGHNFYKVRFPGFVKGIMSCQVVHPGGVMGQCVCVSLICQKMMPETDRYSVYRFAVKSCLY